jgi:5'-AMP-activated protein kinase catalytic alpha subunit
MLELESAAERALLLPQSFGSPQASSDEPWSTAARPLPGRPRPAGAAAGRLSPFLACDADAAPRRGSLLGRPRAALSQPALLDASAAASPARLVPRRDAPAPRADPGDLEAGAGGVAPPPDGLCAISTDAGAASPPKGRVSPSAVLAAGATSASGASTPSDAAGGGRDASPERAPVAAAAEPPAEAQAPADWRAALRVPLFSAAGRLLGYRQNSAVARRRWEEEAAAAACFTPTPPASPPAAAADAARAGAAGVARPPRPRSAGGARWAGGGALGSAELTEAEADAALAAAAASPLRGFPSAEDAVPGYALGPVLGRGGFCVVRKGRHAATGEPVALKVIDKARLADPKDADRVEREVRVMRALAGHVGVVQLLHRAETPAHVWIVMEHCGGGSLLDHVRVRGRLPEGEAGAVARQLLAALQHCHARGVVHRDVKLENVLLDGEGGLRLIDFGLAGYYAPGRPLRNHCGSPSYAAPEMVARAEYLAPPVDVWSLAVVLFACVAGHLPFGGRDAAERAERILAGEYAPPPGASPVFRDLLTRMLRVDPAQRATLEEVAAHPWVAAAPAWAPRGLGPGGAARWEVDAATGAPVAEPAALDALRALGLDADAAARGVRARECSAATAPYHLVREARARAARRAADEARRERPPGVWPAMQGAAAQAAPPRRRTRADSSASDSGGSSATRCIMSG